MIYEKHIEALEDLLAEINTDLHMLYSEREDPMKVRYVEDIQSDIENLQSKLKFVDECLRRGE